MTKKKYKIIIGVFCLIAAAFGFWRAALTRMFAESVGLAQYTTYNSIKLVSNWRVDAFPYFVIILIEVALIVAFLFGKSGSKTLEYKDVASVFCSSLCAFMMVTTAIFHVVYFVGGADYSVTEWMIGVMLLFSCAFFIYASTSKMNPRSTIFKLLALLPTTLFAIRVMDFFLQINSKPNDSTELFHLFSLCAIMMFFLEEGKFSVGAGSGRAYIFYGLSAVLLTLVYALPYVLLSAFWIVTFSLEAIYSCLELVFVIFIISRLFSYGTSMPSAA